MTTNRDLIASDKACLASAIKPRAATTPIEAMIDEACGVNDARYQAPSLRSIRLLCPRCHKCLYVSRDDTDPEGTEFICFGCPDCRSENELPRYYGAKTEMLKPSWEATL